MVIYTIKRLLTCLLSVILIVSIVFMLMRMLPTDYYFTEDELMKLSDQQKNDRLRIAGLLDPVPVQLMDYFNDILHGDFGTSRRIQNSVPVVEVVGGKFKISMQLGLISLGLSIVVGVIIGVIQARFKNGIGDNIGTAYTIFVNAVPPLVTYSLVLVFGVRLFGLPSMFSTRNVAQSSILPVVCLSLGTIAYYAIWTRRYMVDELTKDYIKLAKIKGMSTRSIMFTHVLKNAFVPLIAYLPQSILLTITGSLLVERFFSVPGMGSLLPDAIGRYDTTVVQTVVGLYATLGVLGVFLGDVMMAMLDPRIRLAGKGEVR